MREDAGEFVILKHSDPTEAARGDRGGKFWAPRYRLRDIFPIYLTRHPPWEA